MSEKLRATHTPGPWSIVRYGDGSSLVIHSDEEHRVCFMATPGTYRPESAETIRANASLIAASPALYSALEGMVGLTQLLLARDDLPPQVRVALGETPGESHRVEAARAALSRVDQGKEQGGE